jgi:hypothetical protein
MGSAVSFGHRAVVNAEKNAIPVQPISEVSSAKNENLCDNPPLQEPLQIQIDAHRGRSCRDFHMSHGSPEGPFVIRSALSINSTLLTTPVRVSSSRSLGSASSRNHPSGPNSGDSRAFGARDAIDFLYRRSLISEPASPNDNASDNSGAADVFAQTAMSLGLDNDDLIFNMMYFDDGTVSNFGTMMNTMQQETLALHSENNTPYKLNPANEKAISHLIQEKYKRSDAESDNECAVCKDDIEDDADITRIPQCKHFFHSECLSRWIQLVSLVNHLILSFFEIILYIFYQYFSNLGAQYVDPPWMTKQIPRAVSFIR